jgi:hypothetical protein
MNKHDAIRAVNSSVVTIIGEDAFDANGNPVTYDETAVQAYMDAHAYKEKRQREYPPMAEQLDMIFHNGIDAWKEQIQAVKDKYPKG